jgi:hypothetical protein
MRKLINDTGKISLLISRSFEFTFFSTSNVCSDHGVIDLTAKSRLDEWLRMYVLTYTLTLMTLLEIAVYDRLPVNFAYNMSTKKQKGGEKRDKRRGKIDGHSANNREYVRFFNHSFCILIHIINQRTIKLHNTKKETHLYI